MNPSSFAPRLRAMPGRFTAAVALIVVASILVACGFTRQSPVKRTFLLEPKLPAAAAANPKAASVRMGVVNVAAPFRGKTFVYREADLRYESDYYDEFFVAPAIMISDATAKALASSNVFRRFTRSGAASDEGEYVLDGFVSELYADARDAAAPVAVMTITYYLTPANVVGENVVWTKEYRQRAKAANAGAEAVARGWNDALSAILAELTRDLAAASLPKS